MLLHIFAGILASLTLGSEAVAVLCVLLTVLFGVTGWALLAIYGRLTTALDRLDAKFDDIIDTVDGMKTSVGRLQSRLDLWKERLEHLARENRRLTSMVNSLFAALHQWDVLMARRFPDMAGLSVRMPKMEPELPPDYETAMVADPDAH